MTNDNEMAERVAVSRANALLRRSRNVQASSIMVNSILFPDVVEVKQIYGGLWEIHTKTGGYSQIHPITIESLTLFEPDDGSIPIQYRGEDGAWRYCAGMNGVDCSDAL
jgi:hypothetical protein